MTDYFDLLFCSWYGKKFFKKQIKLYEIHQKSCTDIDETFRGEIDDSSLIDWFFWYNALC